MSGDTEQTNDTKRFFGLLLMAVGVIWLVTTGLCTLVFASFVVQSYQLNVGDVSTMLIVAGPSALIGYAIYSVGRAMRPNKP
jgi:hypothetical protein